MIVILYLSYYFYMKLIQLGWKTFTTIYVLFQFQFSFCSILIILVSN